MPQRASRGASAARDGPPGRHSGIDHACREGNHRRRRFIWCGTKGFAMGLATDAQPHNNRKWPASSCCTRSLSPTSVTCCPPPSPSRRTSATSRTRAASPGGQGALRCQGRRTRRHAAGCARRWLPSNSASTEGVKSDGTRGRQRALRHQSASPPEPLPHAASTLPIAAPEPFSGKLAAPYLSAETVTSPLPRKSASNGSAGPESSAVK